MPDSTLSHVKMQRLPFSPATLELLFVVIYILFFSATLYVMFVSGLDRIQGQTKDTNNLTKLTQLEAYRLQQQVNQGILLLEQRIYLPHNGSVADSEIKQEVTNSLDSLQALIILWEQPQALQIATALRLSVHHYHKILAEAIALSKQENGNEINKVLLNKLALELQPQAGEITSQINDLVELLQTEILHQSQTADQNVDTLKQLIFAILLSAGLVSYFLIKKVLRQLVTQRKELKEQLQLLQITQQEMQLNQQKLTEKEANLCSVINNTSDGIYAINRQYQLTVINQAWQAKLTEKGIYLEVGQDISNMFAGESNRWKEPFERTFAGEKTIVSTRQQQTSGDLYI